MPKSHEKQQRSYNERIKRFVRKLPENTAAKQEYEQRWVNLKKGYMDPRAVEPMHLEVVLEILANYYARDQVDGKVFEKVSRRWERLLDAREFE